VSYYTGDPGFFSIVKSLGGAALGLVPGGGIVKTGMRTAGGLLAAGKGAIMKRPLSAAGAAAGVAVLAAGGMGRAGVFGRAAGKRPSARHLRALAMGLKRAKPRMNVTNVHALRRSLRRAHGFAKLAMRTIHLIHPRKKVRFGGFRKRKHSK
jgi:hypothetical protein